MVLFHLLRENKTERAVRRHVQRKRPTAIPPSRQHGVVTQDRSPSKSDHKLLTGVKQNKVKIKN